MGRVFCNLAVFLDSGWQSIQVSNPPPLAQQFGTLPTQPTIHETPHRWLNTLVSKRFPLCKTFRKSWSKYKWNALRRWKCSGKIRTSLTSRSGPTETCHSFFKHSRVQFYMTDREVINIKFQSKRLVIDASVRLEILFLSSNFFLLSLELITVSVVSDMFVWSKGKSTLRLCPCEIHPVSAIYYKWF